MAARKTPKSRNSTRATSARSSQELSATEASSPAALLQAFTTPWQAAQVLQQVQAQLFQRSTSTMLEAIEKVRAAQSPADAFAAQAEFFWANWMSGMQATADLVQAVGRMRGAQGGDDFANPAPPLYAPASPDAFVRH